MSEQAFLSTSDTQSSLQGACLPIRFPKNDIALVRLQHRMDLKKGDRRVCLPSNALDRNNYQ